MEFRKLRADEIDCRVSTVSDKGCSLLLYKDARCDMNILDETVGAMNWQRSHVRDNANCIVSIWDSEKQVWVSKEDTGKESYTEAEKGLASDSFKRACFNWGIGRELYTSPFIWVNDGNVKLSDKGGKKTTYDRFVVTKIEYKDNVISDLEIYNETQKKVAYKMHGSVQNTRTASKEEEKEERAFNQQAEKELAELATEPQKKAIYAICKAHNVSETDLYMMNGITKDQLTKKQAVQLINSLKNKFGE